MNRTPFHLALPCSSLERTRHFYVDVLGAKKGRSASNWIDIDLFGHQITFTVSGDFNFSYKSYKFGDVVLPSFHFGAIVDETTWHTVHGRVLAADLPIVAEDVFLQDKTGEHRSFFVQDPNGYIVELKQFKRPREIFRA